MLPELDPDKYIPTENPNEWCDPKTGHRIVGRDGQTKEQLIAEINEGD